jgi:ketosteroid isomerase-like protein
MTDTITSNVKTVRAGYEVFARGDMAALSDLFAPDAVWTHRNGGRFSGAKRGFDAITAFFGESVQLSAGTLRVEPTDFLGEGEQGCRPRPHVGHAARRPRPRRPPGAPVPPARRPDGRRRQYVGDPAAVEPFWA